MPTVFAKLTELLQKHLDKEGSILTEAFLDVCRQIIPITGEASETRTEKILWGRSFAYYLLNMPGAIQGHWKLLKLLQISIKLYNLRLDDYDNAM